METDKSRFEVLAFYFILAKSKGEGRAQTSGACALACPLCMRSSAAPCIFRLDDEKRPRGLCIILF